MKKTRLNQMEEKVEGAPETEDKKGLKVIANVRMKPY